MAKKKSTPQKDYFNLSKTVSIILAIIPITSLFCGIITRLMDGKIVAALIRFLFGWNIIWIIDIIMIATKRKIWRLLDV